MLKVLENPQESESQCRCSIPHIRATASLHKNPTVAIFLSLYQYTTQPPYGIFNYDLCRVAAYIPANQS